MCNTMIKILLLATIWFLPMGLAAQEIVRPADIKIREEFENVHTRQLYTDPMVSTFLIEVKKDVRGHYHRFHTEQVYVISGKGEMLLGKRKHKIKAGDFIIIPPNTPHEVKVTGKQPLRVLSIQAPNFDGNDRVWLDDKP